jgi:biotin operon repressor
MGGEIVGSRSLRIGIKERAMKSHSMVPGLLLGLLLLGSPVFAQSSLSRPNIDGIAEAIGKPGDLIGEMYKVSFPRSDLNVRVGDMAIKPALALVAWAAFIKSGDTATTYGDLVLLENEVNPVISKLAERGIEIAALHNHLLHENPRIMYIHFVGRGDEVEMAKGIREAIGLTKTPLTAAPPSAPETKPELAREIERIIGYEGNMGGGVFHIVVPRNDVHVAAMGAMIPGSMGMNTPLNFQLDGKNAAINGDFMLLPAEVNPVIKTLRANGIEVASLHNHMLYDEPRLFFMHFWANADAEKLAKGLRAALDQMKAPRG